MIDPLLCLGCCFLLTGFVLDVISTASREWVLSSDGSTSALWTVCFSTGSCLSLIRGDSLDAVRAMMILSSVVSGIALLIVVVDVASIWINNRNNLWIMRIITALTFLSAVMTLIGILVSKRIDWGINDMDYGYSFWLGVAAIIILFIAGLFFVASAIRYQRELKQSSEQNKKTPVKKHYPFTIPFYEYKLQEQNNHENQHKTTDSEQKSEGKNSGKNPFPSDYRFVPTLHAPLGIYNTEIDGGIYGSNYASAQRFGHKPVDTRFSADSNYQVLGHQPVEMRISADGNYQVLGHQQVDTRTIVNGNYQVLGHQPVETRNSANGDYQNFNYGRSQLANNSANVVSMVGSAAPSSLSTSGFNTKNLYGRSTSSSRVPRDTLGYPITYDRDL